MRPVLCFLLLCLLGGVASAQVQEKKAAERILGPPDHTLNYDLRKSSFGAGRSFSGSKEARVATFNPGGHYQPKSFLAKPFLGNRAAPQGEMRFATRDASTKDYAEAGKTSATRAVPVNDSQYAGRTMDVSTSREAHQSFFEGPRFGHGRSQAAYDKLGTSAANAPVGYSGDLKPMTIDDVRSLLNKNK